MKPRAESHSPQTFFDSIKLFSESCGKPRNRAIPLICRCSTRVLAEQLQRDMQRLPSSPCNDLVGSTRNVDLRGAIRMLDDDTVRELGRHRQIRERRNKKHSIGDIDPRICAVVGNTFRVTEPDIHLCAIGLRAHEYNKCRLEPTRGRKMLKQLRQAPVLVPKPS